MDKQDHYDDMAAELEGNWKSFKAFGWYDEPEDSNRWCIVYTHHRDSGILEQSNAAVIAKALESFMGGDDADCVSEHHGHFAVGWVDGYAIRVRNDEGLTPAFKAWCDLTLRADDYPVLDDEDFSEREMEACIEAISQQLHYVKIKLEDELEDELDLPDDIESQIFSWLFDNESEEVENRDGTGAYPSEESIERALVGLGMVDYYE